MALKDEIVEITVQAITGTREGVGKQRFYELSQFVGLLIKLKENDLSPELIGDPMLNDRLKIGVSAVLSATTKTGGEGGIEWKIVKLSGNYSREQQTGASISAEMEFSSKNAPDFSEVKILSVDDLKKLAEIVNAE